jgi:hypothetical protein
MQPLTAQGQQIVQDLANQYHVSTDAVTTLLYAVSNGNGTMAQFSHPDLGGSGQWMQGGMTMVGDMFNSGLKWTVDGLCNALSNHLMNQPMFQPVPTFQAQNQGGNGANLFVSQSGTGQWWPPELGAPSSTGAQNNARYAVFPQSQRLAIDLNGAITVYDTLDHQIGGVSQQQGDFGSMSFSSQYGYVPVANLPVISVNGFAPPAPAPAWQPAPPQPTYQNPPQDFSNQAPSNGQGFANPSPTSFADNTPLPAQQSSAQELDIFAKIERLADLKQRGILSDDEYSAKKAELLSRL